MIGMMTALSIGFGAERAPTDKFHELAGAGLYVQLGTTRPQDIVALAKSSRWLVYVECSKKEEVRTLREAADQAGLLARRIFVARAGGTRIQLADNLADVVRVAGTAQGVSREEVMRVLRPGGKALWDARTMVKPVPKDLDCWSHPCHGPDNNLRATQRIVEPSFRTQFLAEPCSGAVFRVMVAAGGRVFTAYGDESPCEWLMEGVTNTLWAMNAYHGTCLWTRKLRPGFWVQRNTIIATPDVVYLGDDVSCKALDAATGALRYELTAPVGKDSDRVWKWMGLEGGVLYGLLGGPEVKVHRGLISVRGSQGFSVPEHAERAWGVGRTLVAIRLETKEVLWHRREEALVDSRGMCMSQRRIYLYCPGKHLSCVDAVTGKLIWRTADRKLVNDADREGGRGSYGLVQPRPYLLCRDQFLVFSNRRKPFAVSTKDGALLDAKIAMLPGMGCARVNASLTTQFYRDPFGTGFRDRNWKQGVFRITAMRPHCATGVVPSNGLLYWSPWNCHGCVQSISGNICLAPADAAGPPQTTERLQRAASAVEGPCPARTLATKPSDWPTYLRDNQHSATTSVTIPQRVELAWTATLSPSGPVTAPVAVGGLVFVGGSNGAVYCVEGANGAARWKGYTAAEIFFPPAIWAGRAYVGSCDGHIYAYEAATGRMLWRFRAAPRVRRIPAYGRLTSTWPVAGGVLVEDGVLYAAAGITDYDGIHVYALDAMTGKLKWHTDCAGRELCLGSALSLSGGQLRFRAGNVYPEAQFDRETGLIRELARGRHRMGYDAPPTRRHRLFPRKDWVNQWGQVSGFVRDTRWGRVAILTDPEAREHGLNLIEEARKVDRSFPGKPPRTLTSRGARFFFGPQRTGVVLFKPQASATRTASQDAVWFRMPLSACTAAVVAGGKLILAGYDVDSSEDWMTSSSRKPTSFALKVLRIDTGAEVSSHVLPSLPVPRGVAVDHHGRILVSLENGRLLCFGAVGR